MRHIIDIEARNWDRLQKMLREGRYQSVGQFVDVAVENQLLLEEQELDRGEPPQTVEAISQTVQGATLSMPQNSPKLMKAASKTTGDIVWGLYNRIFPVKVTLRVLARMLDTNQAESIELKSLREESAATARLIGRQLIARSRRNSDSKDDKLATGLPFRRSEKSLDRFKNMFVGTVGINNEVRGFPASLSFVFLRRSTSGAAMASLTESGYEFAGLHNPVLDEPVSNATRTLSSDEADFYFAHIEKVMPMEWALNLAVLDAIRRGGANPGTIDQVITSRVRALKPSLVPVARAGTISRLSELGFVSRTQDGLHVSYVLTERGEQVLKSGYEVTER